MIEEASGPRRENKDEMDEMKVGVRESSLFTKQLEVGLAWRLARSQIGLHVASDSLFFGGTFEQN